ncbi:branched-subunit amino acid transport protein AzlD [Nicoletella semolina]|uniref:Branched-subunit amino acid transport protein AzlD n=1 Tax=Nicoletella semolina TaxID=271160 RepID=A0A4R2NBP7_9PAST|nr:AzlD domain-containing protein [Nicoletella semolina]MDH2925021.1 branched-chain amino acid transport [Nicoletella semolina]TCP18571.1 branched-subunit amino acid transport protein AzlD [Nicoletella semolina]
MTSHLYFLLILMLGTQLCRFIPMVLPKSFLAHPLLQKLNKMLSLVIMVLLILTSLNLPTSGEGYTLFISQILALATVMVSYQWLNNILLSVVCGITSLNLLLYFLGK